MDPALFGPLQARTCACGTKHPLTAMGARCPKCGMEVTTRRARRHWSAHLELHAPVAHPLFLRELGQVLGEVPDRQPRPGRVGVDRGRGDREDARALPAARHAVVGLAAAERGHALEVDDRVQHLAGQPRPVGDLGPHPG